MKNGETDQICIYKVSSQQLQNKNSYKSYKSEEKRGVVRVIYQPNKRMAYELAEIDLTKFN